MSIYTQRAPVTITCHKRITPYLEAEIKTLGFTLEDSFVTGVRINASVNECIKLNLNLRCASQVLYSLFRFPAQNADAVYNNLVDYPWEDILPEPGYFSVTSNVQMIPSTIACLLTYA